MNSWSISQPLPFSNVLSAATDGATDCGRASLAGDHPKPQAAAANQRGDADQYIQLGS